MLTLVYDMLDVLDGGGVTLQGFWGEPPDVESRDQLLPLLQVVAQTIDIDEGILLAPVRRDQEPAFVKGRENGS